ncbi:MAG: alpha/beta hydrolase [Acidimicrobiales bacterium]
MTRPIRIGVLVALLITAIGTLWWMRDPTPVALTPAEVGATRFADVAYGPHDRNRFDVYVPEGAGPHPTVIWFHPGGWVHGDKAASMPVWDWTERGYAVVSVNYRYADDPDTVNDSVDDAIAAVRRIRTGQTEWDLDVDRMGIYGFSAGGHLAAMVGHAGGVDADLRVAAIAIAGAPTDFVALLDPAVPFFDGNRGPDVVVAVQDLLGCTSSPATCEARASAASPARLDPGPADLLVVHAANDHIVDVDQAHRLQAHLEAAGSPAQVVVVDEGGHSPLLEEGGIAEFFDERLLS